MPINPLNALTTPLVANGAIDAVPLVNTITTLDDDAVRRRGFVYSVGDMPYAPNESDNEVDHFNKMRKMTEDTIKVAGDVNIREKARLRDLQTSVSSYATLAANKEYPEQLRRGAQLALQQSLQEQAMQKDTLAAERQYVENMQELMANGNYAQAQMIDTLRRTPTAMEATVQYQARQAYIEKAIEDNGVTLENRDWFSNLLDFAMLNLPFLSSTANSDNYDSDTVTKRWYDNVLSGERLESEVAALRGIRDDDEYKAAVDKLVPALLKSTNDFGWQNKLQFMGLADAFVRRTPSATETNIFDAVDAVLAPTIIFDAMSLGKGAFSLTKRLRAVGARKEAGDMAARAHAKVVEDGAQKMTDEFGMSVEDVEEAMSPSAINPDTKPGDIPTGANTTELMSENERLARDLIGEMSPSQRLNEEEWAGMVKGLKAKYQKDFGRHVEDIEFDNVQLANGSLVHVPTVIFGTTKKSLFASKDAAIRAMSEMGLESRTLKTIKTANGEMYGIEAKLPITESSYYVKQKDTAPKNFIERFIYGARQTTSEETYGLGERSVARQQKIMTQIEKEVAPVFSKLSNSERQVLQKLMIKAEKEQKWFDNQELALLYARLVGKGDGPVEITNTELKLGDLPASGVDNPFLEPHTYKAWREGNTPPVAPGKVRVYHGGGPTNTGGGRWITDNLKDAEGWGSRDPSMKVWYTDIDANDPRRITPGETEAMGFAPRGRFELTEDEAKQMRELGKNQFPSEHEDMWKALDRAAEEAQLRESNALVDVKNAARRYARLENVAAARKTDPHLDKLLDDLRDGVSQNEIARRADGTRSSTARLYGHPSRKQIRDLIKEAKGLDPRFGTRANGVRVLKLPGERFVAWEGSQDFHDNIINTLNNLLEDRGLPALDMRQVENIFIEVSPSGKAGAVQVARSPNGLQTWEHAETKPIDQFLQEVEDATMSGKALDKRVRDAGTRANRMTDDIQGARNENTEIFRKQVDDQLSAKSIKKLTNANGDLLQWNRNKVMTKDLEYDPSMDADLSPQVKAAFNKMVELNKVDHILREQDIYLGKAVRGMQTASFKTARGDVADTNVMVYRKSNPTVPGSRVYNITDDVHYVAKSEDEVVAGSQELRLNESSINKLMKDGYILVRTEQPQVMRGGVYTQWFVGKASDFEVKPLKAEQLGYVEGGHRGYKEKYFVKQAHLGKQGDNGEKFLMNPRTFIVGTKAEADEWRETMETARAIYNNTSDDEARRMDLLSRQLDNKVGYPSADEFVSMIEKGEFDPEFPLEALYDRENPSAYASFRQSMDDMTDPEESGLNTYMQTHGRMYYSPKGSRLPDWRGQDATLVDPFEMLNKSLNNIAMLTSFSDYKLRSIEKWVKTYQDYLDLSGLPKDASPIRIFQESVFKTDLPQAMRIKNSAEAQRDTVKRILGWRSDLDREFDYMSRRLVNFVAGTKAGSVRNKVGNDVGNWVKDTNPVAKARGMAFDAKLGLFNIGQFPMQISTIFAAASIETGKAWKAAHNLPGMIGYLNKNAGDEWLDLMVERGVHKMSGFDDPAQYKEMMKEAKRSGFFDIGGTHQLINEYGPSAAMGAIGKPLPILGDAGLKAGQAVSDIVKAGRFFFNEAERWNRIFAWQIAWKRALEKGLTPGNSAFYENVMQGANDFAFNMSKAGAAAWQKGWTSIPTQFLAYQARMLEAMMGKQFTTPEKLRLLLGQGVLYGAAGLPFVSFATELMRGQSGEAPELGTWEGLAERGVIDTLVFAVTGVDTQYSERAGTGSFITDTFRELIGMSRYGETSFIDVMGGPLWGMTKDLSKTFWDAVKFSAAESGGDTGLGLSAGSLMNLARNVSTINNAYKAYMVWNYGQYVSKNNKLLLDEMPSTDAFAVMLGLTPGQYRDLIAKQDWRKNRTETIKQVSDKIVEMRQRLWRDPENSESVMREMQLFMGMQPEDIRIDAITQANRSAANEDVYSGLARRYELEKNQQALGAKKN